jgi:hypothetical protein
MGMEGDAGAHPVVFRAFADDAPADLPPQGSSATKLRIVHAAPEAPTTDFVIGVSALGVPQQSLAYGSVSAAATMAPGALVPDSRGYLTTTAAHDVITATRGGKDIASFATYYFGRLRGASVFLLGLDGSAETPPALLVCDDGAVPLANHRTKCDSWKAPWSTTVRFEHAAPDLPAVDVCVRLLESPKVFGPFAAAAGLTIGLAYKQLSAELATSASEHGHGAHIRARWPVLRGRARREGHRGLVRGGSTRRRSPH